MLSCYSIILNTENGKREIVVSPLLLQSKELPDVKAGKVYKLFFYEYWMDEEYMSNVEKEYLPDQFKADNYLINYGQDFSKHYLGSLNIDSDSKCYSDWKGQPGKLNETEVKTLGESLFDPNVESRRIIIFTPTRPSDFKLQRVEIR